MRIKEQIKGTVKLKSKEKDHANNYQSQVNKKLSIPDYCNRCTNIVFWVYLLFMSKNTLDLNFQFPSTAPMQQ